VVCRVAAERVVIQRSIELRLIDRRARRQTHIGDALAIGVPHQRLRRGAAACVWQRVRQRLAAGDIDETDRGFLVAAFGRAVGHVPAIGRRPITRNRNASVRGIRIDQHARLPAGPRLRHQYRLRLRRRLAHVEQGAAHDFRIELLGGRERQFAHAFREGSGVLEAVHHLFGVGVLRRDPLLHRGRVGVFQPAIGIAHGGAEERIADIVLQGGRRHRGHLVSRVDQRVVEPRAGGRRSCLCHRRQGKKAEDETSWHTKDRHGRTPGRGGDPCRLALRRVLRTRPILPTLAPPRGVRLRSGFLLGVLSMNRIAVAGLVCFLVSGGTLAAAPQDASPATAPGTVQKLSLEQIMADPDWIGPPVEEDYWSVDDRSIYFKLKRKGSSIRDLYRVAADGGTPKKLSDAELANADGPVVFDRARARAAFVRHGDVFVREVASGTTRQLTRDDADKSGLQISADGNLVSWNQGQGWYVWNAATGVVAPAATLKTEDNPADAKPDQMERLQLDLFSTLRADKADKDAVREHDDKLDAENPAPQSLLLLDLQHHKQYRLSLDDLPGIHHDPLHDLRTQRIAQLKKEGHVDEAAALAAPKTR